MVQRNCRLPKPVAPSYTVLEHTADLGFEVNGQSRTGVFEHAARALFDLMWHVLHGHEERLKIEVTGKDEAELMVNFLEEFLFLHETRRLLFCCLRIQTITEHRLVAVVWGHVFEAGRDELRLGVKAVTYHQLFVGRDAGGWRARVFLDI